jgi:thioredoxin:protein disulfide reductase
MKKYCLFLMLTFYSLLCCGAPPPADAVFQLSAKQTDPNAFLLTWHIKEGFFLYKKSIHLDKATHTNITLGPISFPAALKKTNAQGLQYAVYHKQLVLPISISGRTAGETLLNVHFQGCSEDGFCYPPQRIEIKLTIDKELNLTDASIEQSEQALNTVEMTETIKGDAFDQLFATHNWILIILGFFSAGLLLAFTPCLLPMIPVLSGIIVGHSKPLSTRKAFSLSLCYVLSMAVTYSMVGALIAFMGSNLQLVMQSAWAIGLFSLLFVLLALSMFGVYELRLPLTWQNQLARLTRNSSGGHYLSAGLIGALSILILSPCVTAPLIGALTYIAHEGNITLGMLALFFLSLGMGTPLLLIGTSAGKLLPKAGAWMNTVKAFFGVLLLAVAIFLLSRLLPSVLTMGLWGSLLIFSSLYLDVLSFNTQSHQEKFRQGTGLILLFYGFLILIGASLGHQDPLQPLMGTKTILKSPAKHTAITLAELDVMLMQAKSDKKPVMLDFYADWCASCKTMMKTTLRDAGVKTALHDFRVIIVDLSANNADTNALLHKFNVVAPPTFLFIDAQGQMLEKLRLVGEVSATTLINSAYRTIPSRDQIPSRD